MTEDCVRWNERYRAVSTFFGHEPNALLTERIDSLPGVALTASSRVLSLGEGEGRDAIYLARRGLAVTAVDGASEALMRLTRHAENASVAVDTVLADVVDYVPPERAFDLVLLFFLHLDPAARRTVHARAAAALAPGGSLILQAFTPRQHTRGYHSGGPRELHKLYEPSDLRADFASRLEICELVERTVTLSCGLHSGPAAVVDLIGRARPAETP
jgi:SAM-dependent methyltransferase